MTPRDWRAGPLRVLLSLTTQKDLLRSPMQQRLSSISVPHLSNTLRSAKLTLGRAAIFAADSGHRVISVDYTLAPEAKFC
jgi:hypothetical protein